ncbi:MAG TPA: tetratricopeptide repeat protein, partial [Blastocatellia bacterium]|nr:tetratricopeptide repeat protein [Blastocatellia bacterium]
MMKRVFIFLCIAVSASFSISAQPIDQNKTGFTQQPAQPIEAIIRASYQAITEERFEEAYQKASLALELSRSRGLKAREARASQLLALSSFYLGRTDEAIAYFKQAASLAGEADDPRIQNIQTTMLHRAGVLLWLAGRYNDALYCLSQALKIHRQRKDREGVASTLNKLSLIYSETGDFVKATQALNESLEIAKTSNDQALEAS